MRKWAITVIVILVLGALTAVVIANNMHETTVGQLKARYSDFK